jgi:hypothetical protein
VPAVAPDVTVTLPVVWPPAIAMLAAENVTRPVAPTTLTTTPPAGAGLLNVTVNGSDESVIRLTGDGVNVTVNKAVTVTGSVAGVRPVPDAVIVSLPAEVPAVTPTVPVVAPLAIVMLGVAKLTRPVALVKLTTCPPAGAGLLRLTVSVVLEPASSVSGEGLRDSVGVELTVNGKL